VETVSGGVLGTVAAVEGGAGATRLVMNGPRGEILIPLVVDICVDIDVDAKRIRIDPPDGLLALNERGPAKKPSGFESAPPEGGTHVHKHEA
jgi:hypothetical protein